MDLADFYDGDSRRPGSPEVRFGGQWLDESGYAYAVGWLEDTGELYALRQVETAGGPPPFADPWAHVRPRRHDVDTEIFVLLTEPSRPKIDALLTGWPDLQAEPGSFEKLIARLDAAGYPPPW